VDGGTPGTCPGENPEDFLFSKKPGNSARRISPELKHEICPGGLHLVAANSLSVGGWFPWMIPESGGQPWLLPL